MCIGVFIPIPITRAVSIGYALMGQLHSKHSLHFGQLSRPHASACAYAEINYDHHLATLTIESFHRMQFRNGILLRPILHAVPKTCACVRSIPLPSPTTYLSCMHLWAIYTRSLHLVSVNLFLSMPRWRLRRRGGQSQSPSNHTHDRVIDSLLRSHNLFPNGSRFAMRNVASM